MARWFPLSSGDGPSISANKRQEDSLCPMKVTTGAAVPVPETNKRVAVPYEGLLGVTAHPEE